MSYVSVTCRLCGLGFGVEVFRVLRILGSRLRSPYLGKLPHLAFLCLPEMCNALGQLETTPVNGLSSSIYGDSHTSQSTDASASASEEGGHQNNKSWSHGFKTG